MTLSLWTFQLLGSWRTIQPNNFSTGLTYCTIHIIQAWLLLIMDTNWENSFLKPYDICTVWTQDWKFVKLVEICSSTTAICRNNRINFLYDNWINYITKVKHKHGMNKQKYFLPNILWYAYYIVYKYNKYTYSFRTDVYRIRFTYCWSTYIYRVNVRTAHASTYKSLRFRTHGFYIFRSFTGK